MKESTFKKYCLIVDEWLVNGNNGTKAYKKLHPESSDENAAVRFHDLVRISKIADYIETKRQNKAEELNITLEKQVFDPTHGLEIPDKVRESLIREFGTPELTPQQLNSLEKVDFNEVSQNDKKLRETSIDSL